MKNLLKSTSTDENFAGFIFLEGGPKIGTSIDDPTKKPTEGSEKGKKDAEAVKENTESGRVATEKNNKDFDSTFSSVNVLNSVEEMGMAELLNESQINKINQDLNEILKNTDNLQKIMEGTMGVVVYGSASHHKINGELKYNIDGQERIITNNQDLANLRAEMSETIVRNFFKEQGVNNITIKREVPDGGVAKDDKRISGISLYKPVNIEKQEEISTTKKVLEKTDLLLTDTSGSMKKSSESAAKIMMKNNKPVVSFAKSEFTGNYNDQIAELPLQTLAKYLTEEYRGKSITILTDEISNDSDFLNKINKLEATAKELKIKVNVLMIDPKFKEPKNFKDLSETEQDKIKDNNIITFDLFSQESKDHFNENIAEDGSSGNDSEAFNAIKKATE